MYVNNKHKPTYDICIYVGTESDSSDSGLLSFASDLVIIIAFAVILVLCIIITALIMFIVMCVCIRRKYKSAFASQPEKSPYHTVDQSITKNDLDLHPNPAYAAGDNMTMNSNPAYKTCNWQIVYCVCSYIQVAT